MDMTIAVTKSALKATLHRQAAQPAPSHNRVDAIEWNLQPVYGRARALTIITSRSRLGRNGSLFKVQFPLSAIRPGFYLVKATCIFGKRKGSTCAKPFLHNLRAPRADVTRWSAKTSGWKLIFKGMRKDIVALARQYVAYYRPILPHLFAANSRELDTFLGASAVLFAARKDTRARAEYRNTLLAMALCSVVMQGSNGDPTVANDIFPSYRFMREQGVFTTAESQRIEDYFWRIRHEFTFYRQRSFTGRLAQLSSALSDSVRAQVVAKMAENKRLTLEKINYQYLFGDEAFGYDRVRWKHAMFQTKVFKPKILINENLRRASRFFFSIWPPNGVHPGYGDHTGASLWDAVTPEWMAAHYLGNAEYKAIAIRALQFALDHDQLRERGCQPALWQMWVSADDGLVPKAPSISGGLIESTKVVLRDGWHERDAYLLWDLDGGKGNGHGHRDQGAVNYLIWKGLPWIVDTNYSVREASWHNGLLVAGAKADGRMQDARFVSHDDVSLATAVDQEYVPGKLSWRRTIIHVKSRYFAVIDSVRARADMVFDGSPRWHVKGRPVARDHSGTIEFRQRKAALRITVTPKIKLEPVAQPRQESLGTGCPPESYALYWGQPYHRLSSPRRLKLRAGDQVGWITIFALVGKARIRPRMAKPDTWPQSCVIRFLGGEDRIECGDDPLVSLVRRSSGKDIASWRIPEKAGK